LPRTVFHSLFISNAQLVAGTDSGIFVSTNNGTNWTASNTGLTNLAVYSFLNTENKLLAGTRDGVFISTNNGVSWSRSSTGISVKQFTIITGSGADIFVGGAYTGEFHSSNNGSSWVRIDTGSSNINSIAILNSSIFTGTMNNGLFRSTMNSTDWVRVDSGFVNPNLLSITVSGSSVIAATYNGWYRSTNNGTTWETANSGLPSVPYYPSGGVCFAVFGSKLYAGANSPATIFLSTNDGISWTDLGHNGIDPLSGVTAFASIDTNLFATTYYGLYRSTNGGASWTTLNADASNPPVYRALAVSGKNLFAGNYNGVFMSSDNGQSWNDINTGFQNFSVNTAVFPNYIILGLYVSGGNLFAATYNKGVWKRPLSEITKVQEMHNDIPKEYVLEQNYPNPFNPSTIIRYQVPINGIVTLKVFDVLGKVVRTLVDERQSAGSHSVSFNASDLPSGVYFYRLRVGLFTNTRKMMVLK
jgi:photosystem II stability/assembly factor-like uncharacterized protein